jgi:hypothetical protein
VIAAVAGLALLSACNVVETSTPLFAAADEAGAARLRPGVWKIFQNGECTFDERQPIDQWPDCVGGAVVKAGEMVGYDKKDSGGAWEHDPFILAAGAPRIAQIRMEETLGVGASAEASGGATASASASGGGVTHSYGYAGVRAIKTDSEGFITAVTFWPVMCGPPPPKNPKGEDVAMGTLKPLPGMIMKPGDATCTTTSQAALRAAARASEAWKEASPEAHWLRDGDR